MLQLVLRHVLIDTPVQNTFIQPDTLQSLNVCVPAFMYIRLMVQHLVFGDPLTAVVVILMTTPAKYFSVGLSFHV